MASLDGTKTHENLKEAFAGESQAILAGDVLAGGVSDRSERPTTGTPIEVSGSASAAACTPTGGVPGTLCAFCKSSRTGAIRGPSMSAGKASGSSAMTEAASRARPAVCSTAASTSGG